MPPRTRASRPAPTRSAGDRAMRSEAVGRVRSLGESVLQQDPERREPITPGYLLPLFVAAAVIGDRHFVDTIPALENFGGHLRLDAEAVGLQGHRPQHLGSHRL